MVHTFSISKGIFDGKPQAANNNLRGTLVGYVSFEFEIDFLRKLIASSLHNDASADASGVSYSIYSADLRTEIISQGLEVNETERFTTSLIKKQFDKATTTASGAKRNLTCVKDTLVPKKDWSGPSHLETRSGAQSLREAWDYVRNPSDPKYAATWDWEYVMYLCHNSERIASNKEALNARVQENIDTVGLLVVLISALSFSIICYVIRRFAIQVTKPITQLTNHTKKYQNAKGLEQKEAIIRGIKTDKMFENTELKIEKEHAERGDFEYSLTDDARNTTLKDRSAKLQKKKTARELSLEKEHQSRQEKLKGVDAKCDDEIDELKKIFYQFFVSTGNLKTSEQNKLGDRQKNSKKAWQGTNKQSNKDFDGIRQQLRELYDERDERRRQQTAREAHDLPHTSCRSGHTKDARESKTTLEAERYRRYERKFDLTFAVNIIDVGDHGNDSMTLQIQDGLTPM